MAEGPLEGLHILIVPTWYPTPEAPTGGRIFKEYLEAFARGGARVGLLYPDLIDLGNVPQRMSQPGYWHRVREMGLYLWPSPVLRDETYGEAPVVRVRGLYSSFGKKERRIDCYFAWLERAYRHYVSKHGAPNVLNAHCATPAGWAALRLAETLTPRPRVVVTEHTGPFSLLLTPPAVAERTLAACREADAVCAVGSLLRTEMQGAGVTRPIEIIPNAVSSSFRFTEMPP
ncbi:MAG TPA: glycosyltransferase, partial [Candidatus Eisenbacteria bacterium]|nr:glycosyltransferase [Candidatus Eisenbacteria bacterium]